MASSGFEVVWILVVTKRRLALQNFPLVDRSLRQMLSLSDEGLINELGKSREALWSFGPHTLRREGKGESCLGTLFIFSLLAVLNQLRAQLGQYIFLGRVHIVSP